MPLCRDSVGKYVIIVLEYWFYEMCVYEMAKPEIVWVLPSTDFVVVDDVRTCTKQHTGQHNSTSYRH